MRIEVVSLLIDIEGIKGLNRELMSTEPTSHLGAYIWGQPKNQYEPIIELLRELILFSAIASFFCIICAAAVALPLEMVFQEKVYVTFLVLIAILVVSLLVLVHQIGREIDLARETPQYAKYKEEMLTKDLAIVEDYMRTRHLSSCQRMAFYETCIRERDAFLSEKDNVIAGTFAIEGAVGLAVVFALVQVLIDQMPPDDAVRVILAAGFAIYGLLKIYRSFFDLIQKSEKRNPVGKLARVLEFGRINGTLNL